MKRKICAYCGDPIARGQGFVQCSECDQLVHRGEWEMHVRKHMHDRRAAASAQGDEISGTPSSPSGDDLK